MEMPPDTLESVGVNELFVAVTVDASFTTEQAVVGRIDEIHILIAVRTPPIVGYLSPSQICDACSLFRARKLDMAFSICPSRPGDFFWWGKFVFFKNSRPIPGESSMSPTPLLQNSCSSECVFVGLGDRVQHSSFCGFCMLVIC
jgi:hypothetical protein